MPIKIPRRHDPDYALRLAQYAADEIRRLTPGSRITGTPEEPILHSPGDEDVRFQARYDRHLGWIIIMTGSRGRRIIRDDPDEHLELTYPAWAALALPEGSYAGGNIWLRAYTMQRRNKQRGDIEDS